MTDESAGTLPTAVTKAYDVLLWLMVRLACPESIEGLTTNGFRLELAGRKLVDQPRGQVSALASLCAGRLDSD